MEKNKKMCHFYMSLNYKDMAEKYFQIPLTDLIKFAIILDDEKIKNELRKAHEDSELFKKRFNSKTLKEFEEKQCFSVCLPNKLFQSLDKNNMSRNIDIKLKNFLRKVCGLKID